MSLPTLTPRLPTQDDTHCEDDPTGTAQDPSPADGAADTSDTNHSDTDGSGGVRAAAARAVPHLVTALAGLVVLLALLLPNHLSRLTPAVFLRVPVEAVLIVNLLLVLPARPRRAVAALTGAGLGLLLVLKMIDMGFYAVLARPVDPVLDWVLMGPAVEFLTVSVGPLGTAAAVASAVVLALAVPVLTVLAVLRLTRLAARRATTTARAAAAAGLAWLACAALGLQIVAEVPIADRTTSAMLSWRAHQVHASLLDQRYFARQAAVDPFRDTPADQLLSGLRGKDVIVAFVESYGRSAIEDPLYAPQVGALLDAGDHRLTEAGFAARSGFLTSPTAGGSSWLAHSTFLSGLWIKNQQRYQTLVASDRLTIPEAFRRANWDTVAVMPGVTRAWPEGDFYGYGKVYDSRNLGYRGPDFGWGTVPDQFTLSAFERLARRSERPVMAEIALVTSHAPWTPLPWLIDWDDVGDGSGFAAMTGEGDPASEVWKERGRVRTAYRHAIEYSINSLISYVQTYGDDDTVLVFLGDHQPAPLITGPGASKDVPVSIVARDPAVLDRIAAWGWHEGLKPGPQAPVWRMDKFRDRFLSAFGPGAPQAVGARQPS